MKTDREFTSLFELYSEALEQDSIHRCTQLDLKGVDVEKLFDDRYALIFIKEYFGRANQRKDRSGPFSKLYELIDGITSFRAKHTVSAFLLGIMVKEKLHINIKSWARLYNTQSSDESFGFFWSVICLLHDIGYKYEYHSSNYAEIAKTASAFCVYANVKYNLLAKTKHRDLIEKYYSFRINGANTNGGKKTLDHGIVAGILVYDALMEIYYHSDKITQSEFCGMQIRGSFDSFVLRIAEAIALHNMWLASPDTVSLYKEYNLHELIPDNKDLVIYYEDDPLRFLLGLIDTIDPIKFFCNSEEKGQKISPVPPKDLIGDFLIGFRYTSRDRYFHMMYSNSDFDAYTKKMCKQDTWLGIKQLESTSQELILLVKKRAQIETKKAS